MLPGRWSVRSIWKGLGDKGNKTSNWTNDGQWAVHWWMAGPTEWQEGQLSSASASKQCLGSGSLVVPAHRGLVLPSHCLRCRMPFLSHSSLSFESMLYQIRGRKALSERICILPCRAPSVAFLKAHGCISVILIFLWHLSICLHSVGGEPPKQHLKGLSCYSSFPLFFALLPKPRKSWNNPSLLVIRHIWFTKYWLQLQNAFRKSNCRKILKMKITYITFYKYKESSKMEAHIASFKAGLKILDSLTTFIIHKYCHLPPALKVNSW